jgi:integrase
MEIKPYQGYTTKNRRARAIPISDKLIEILKVESAKTKSPYVCRPYQREATISEYFLNLLRKLGIEGKLHDLRHTFASHLAMSGASIQAIKEFLGHSDITTTMIYSHLSPESLKEEISKLPY